jgi:hypothetical protein
MSESAALTDQFGGTALKSLIMMVAGSMVVMLFSATKPDTRNPKYEFPLIKSAGGIVPLPDAAFQPERGAKVILDITGDNEADKVTKGVDRAALLINLHADADVDPEAIRATIIIHGKATRAVLTHEAYARHTKASKNPNLKVFKDLRQAGVEIFVCGQALAHQKLALEDVSENVAVAASASTVLIDHQMDGDAYIPFH